MTNRLKPKAVRDREYMELYGKPYKAELVADPMYTGNGKKQYPHISIVFRNKEELARFDEAIAEEKKKTKMPGLNRSKIIRKLVNKWVKYEVSI